MRKQFHVTLVQFLHDDLAGGGDVVQRVVELVSDAGGEHPQGGHLLALDQLVLASLQFRHHAVEGLDHPLGLIPGVQDRQGLEISLGDPAGGALDDPQRPEDLAADQQGEEAHGTQEDHHGYQQLALQGVDDLQDAAALEGHQLHRQVHQGLAPAPQLFLQTPAVWLAAFLGTDRQLLHQLLVGQEFLPKAVQLAGDP